MEAQKIVTNEFYERALTTSPVQHLCIMLFDLKKPLITYTIIRELNLNNCIGFVSLLLKRVEYKREVIV